jgi:hypothetical protein
MVLAMLGLLLVLGVSFSAFSRQTGQDVASQADTLRARALARAGLAKVQMVLRRQLEAHNYSWRYPEQNARKVPPSEFEGRLGDGTWRVVSVEPLVFRRGDAAIGPYRNRPYRPGGEAVGYYDVCKVVTEGFVPRTSTGVRMTSLLKIVRRQVVPQ